MKQTYKTDHPTIKYITIGDKFVTKSGKIVTFDGYNNDLYPEIPFSMSGCWCNTRLLCTNFEIKYKQLNIKDKLNLL